MDLLSALPVPLTDQIACVEREIAIRRRVYPRRVGNGAMSQDLADRETSTMSAVLETLRQLAATRSPR